MNSSVEPAIRQAEEELGVSLPDDYKQFLRNGAPTSDKWQHDFLAWQIDELPRWNEEYGFPEYAPGLIGFGSNGGGEAYAFATTKTPWRIVLMPFIGMEPEVAIPFARSFEEFLARVEDPRSLFDLRLPD
jgi:hypothetical protein